MSRAIPEAPSGGWLLANATVGAETALISSSFEPPKCVPIQFQITSTPHH